MNPSGDGDGSSGRDGEKRRGAGANGAAGGGREGRGGGVGMLQVFSWKGSRWLQPVGGAALCVGYQTGSSGAF